MSRRTAVLLAGLVGVALLAGVLLWLDVHASRSDTRANASMSSFSIGKPQGPDAGVGGELKLVVLGESDLASALQRELAANLADGPVFEGVETAELPLSPAGDPALLVELPRQEIFWTPFLAKGRLTVKVVYASDGDLSWREGAVVHLDGSSGPVLRARGELRIEDSTAGVVSRPHYYRHLGLRIATEVGKSIEKSVNTAG